MQAVVAELRTDLVVVLTGAAPLPLVHCASVYVYAGTVPTHNGAAVGAGVGAEVGDDVGEAVP
jgi:hypothetical protein